jgi:hypothetical protein
MKYLKLTLTITVLLTALLAITPAWAGKDMPAINDEGMELVKDTELATVYADPGTDLGVYKRIWLEDATVSFKKNWQRDQNRGHTMKVRNSDMERITEDVATLFREVFTEKLTEGGYEMATEAGPDVLTLKPAIVDLDVYAPDVRGAGMTRSYSESAGEMTLNLELFDSLTGDKIVKATDRKRDYDKGYMQWRTRVSNRSDAKRMMTSWAEAFTSLLEETKTSSGNSN